MGLNKVSKKTVQSRFKASSVWDRFRQQHGKWFDKWSSIQEGLADEEAIKPFDLTYATANQMDAIQLYMRQEGKTSISGFMTWMRWNEKTFYDILRTISPDGR